MYFNAFSLGKKKNELSESQLVVGLGMIEEELLPLQTQEVNPHECNCRTTAYIFDVPTRLDIWDVVLFQKWPIDQGLGN